MYQNREFHDSYYYHTCLIIPEKDVLETDIVGTGCGARLVRWWNDLFLLSYTCERSRGFYNSSHAMRIERFRQFRKYKHRIHPMSKFRNFWDCLILHVIIINKILFRFTSSFIFDKLPISLFYFGAFFELIFIADLCISMMSGYINSDAKRVILDTNTSVHHFCTNKLFIHFVSAFPLHWFMFLRYGTNVNCGLCKTNKFICALKIISVFSLFRVIETSAYWTQKRHSTNKIHFFKFLRIGALGIITMCQFYDLTDVVSLLVFINEGHVVHSSLLGMRTGFRYADIEDAITNFMYVCYDINRVLKALHFFSYGISEKVYYLDKMAALGAFTLANIFYAWSLLECYAIVSRTMYPNDRLMRMKDAASNLLTCRQLSDELRSKVDQYFNFKPTKVRMIERKNELYRILPDVLKKEIKRSCYIKLIMRIPFFTNLPLPLVEKIVLMLKNEVFLENDIVAEAWVQADGLIIVDNGVLAVYSQYNKERGHLIDGDYFGELSLVTDKELCMSYVVAVTPCTVLILEKRSFRKLMRKYPKLFSEMKLKMKEIYAKKAATFQESEISEHSITAKNSSTEKYLKTTSFHSDSQK